MFPIITLEKICEVIAGQSPPSSTYNYVGKGLPFFQGKADFGTLYPAIRVWCDKPIKIAKPNDILISVRAPVGPTNLCQTESCIGRGLSGIRVKDGADYKYVLFYLRAIEPQLSLQGRGSTFTAITQSEIRNLQIPFPPLPVQKQIAAILEKADAAREKRRQANQLTDQFLQSAFLEMFGNPVTNPKGWKNSELTELCDKITDGTHDTPKRVGKGVKFITGKNIRPFRFDFTELEYVTKEIHDEIYKRCNPIYGDVLYTNIGANVGTALMNYLTEEFSMKNVALLKHNRSFLNSRYLEHILNNVSMKASILRRFSIGGAQSFLSLTNINRISIPFPPLVEQQKFAALVEKVESLRTKHRESEKELENLFQSLMQRAFKGELEFVECIK